MNNQTLETVIESRRKELGLTKKAIYDKLGMSSVGYSQMLERGTVTLKNLLLIAEILMVDVNYLLGGQTILKAPSKPVDGGKFGSDVEEELRSQVEMLKSQLAETNRNNEFLREMMRNTLQQLNMSMSQLAETMGKDFGDEAKCLPLRPDGDEPLDIKMRA